MLDFSEMPELMSDINERNTQLLDRLKNVYVSSPDKVCVICQDNRWDVRTNNSLVTKSSVCY